MHIPPRTAWLGHPSSEQSIRLRLGAASTAFWIDPANRGAKIPLQIKGSPTLRVPGPGHRPFWWWNQIAPEPRRISKDDGSTVELWDMTWAKGLRIDWQERGRGRFSFGVPTSHPPGLTFESEAAYLKRLGLLKPDEH